MGNVSGWTLLVIVITGAIPPDVGHRRKMGASRVGCFTKMWWRRASSRRNGTLGCTIPAMPLPLGGHRLNRLGFYRIWPIVRVRPTRGIAMGHHCAMTGVDPRAAIMFRGLRNPTPNPTRNLTGNPPHNPTGNRKGAIDHEAAFSDDMRRGRPTI